MANLFEQFHADFPGAQGFQDLPVKEKKKKKNVFAEFGSRALEELSAGLISPASADEGVAAPTRKIPEDIPYGGYHPGMMQGRGEAGRGGGVRYSPATGVSRPVPSGGPEDEEPDKLVDYLLGVVKPMDRMKSTGSFLMDILKQLGRPGSSLLTGAKRGAEAWKDPESWKQDRIFSGPGGFPIPQRAIEEGVAGLKEGFTYEDETRGQDFLSEEFRKNNPKSAFGIGFAIDWLTDPLTHGAHRLITGPIEASAKATGRQLSKSCLLYTSPSPRD